MTTDAEAEQVFSGQMQGSAMEGCCVVPCLVSQSYPTFSDPMDYSLPGSSDHGDSPGKNTGV